MTVNPQGSWGSYGERKPGFQPFDSAMVNSDGTFASGGTNLKMTKGGAGNYIIDLLDDKGNVLEFPPDALVATAINTSGIPFTYALAFGIGPSGHGIQVSSYNPTPALSDSPFQFTVSLTSKYFS